MKQINPLTYVTWLYEVGSSIVDGYRDWQHLQEQIDQVRAEAAKRIKDLRGEQARLVQRTEKAVRQDWSSREIREAEEAMIDAGGVSLREHVDNATTHYAGL